MLTRLVEPAAIVLGDMWTQGDLEEVDVTLGLCRLRAAVCQAAHPYLNAAARSPLRVLSAASPGEVHALGPTLHPQVMWQAGWSPRVVAGESEDALLDTLAREHFDCLDLSGSAALPGDDRVHALAATIARARRASRNPALAVLLGGRGAASLASRAGADAAVLCARDLVRTARAAVELRAS